MQQPTGELDTFLVDLNGILRGKRSPLSSAGKLLKEGLKMPRSALGVDCWGDDVVENGLVFETGDNDGICLPVATAATPIPWLNGDHFQLQTMMQNPDGSPFMADPRQILAAVCQRYREHGLTPVVASELEFYLLADSELDNDIPLANQRTFDWPDVYSLDCIDEKRDLLADIRQCCVIQGIPADAIISELGAGQFEINLNHVPDALQAADHAVLFKRLVKGVARKHQHRATFMPKPFGERSGNGFHLHFSVLDKDGNNVFDNGTPQGNDTLTQAVAGLLEAMADAMLIFAPGLNAYRRLLPGMHAPVSANWGYENRTVSVRIPDSPNSARRIEHRVSGADANPYLVIAVVLAAALNGIEQQMTPPPACIGDGYSAENMGAPLPTQWVTAIEAMQDSTLIKALLGEEFVRVFCAIKRQENLKFAQQISHAEYETYL